MSVNVLDLILFQGEDSVYRGDLFSYKLFNFVHVALASWIYA